MSEIDIDEKKFEKYCYELIRQHIEAIASEAATSIYALSFYVENNLDDSGNPTLTLGYNTLKQMEESTPLNDSLKHKASDQDEAKWNYAFWLQNQLCVIGQEGTTSQTMRNEWIESLLPWEDATQCFVNLCVRVSRQLHQDRIVQQRFGTSIPIIIHELEYYDQIAHQTSAANPAGLADEFVNWVFTSG